MVASLLEELASRGGLGAALGQRDPASLLPLLDHIRRHVGDPRYAPLLSAVAHRLLDAYSGVVGRDSQVRCRASWAYAMRCVSVARLCLRTAVHPIYCGACMQQASA